jgi:hypothetical protein
MTPSGISNLLFAFVMIDDNGDPNDELIEIGHGRLFYDSDDISERVNSYIRSASDDIRHLPSIVSRKKE